MNKENLQIQQTLKLAYENHKKGNLKLAESLYKKIIKVNKKNFEVFFLLGSLCLQKRDFKEAINLLDKAIKIEPKNANSYQNLGYAFTELGEFEKAKLALDKAIEIQPKHADAHFNLANVYKQTRNFEKAKIYYEKTIQIQPTNASALNNLANVYKRLGKFQQAIKSYNKAIAVKPDHGRAYHNLGYTYNQLGETSKAIIAFKKAFEVQPSNLESLYAWSDLDEEILDLELKKKIKYIMEKGKLSKKDIGYGNFLLAKYEFKDRNYEKELEYLLIGHENYYEANQTFFDKGINYWLKNLPKIKELEKINKPEINNNIKPIFIIGVPRCGSTVVEKVIASGKNKIPMGEECGVISLFVGEIILAEKSFNKNIENLKEKIHKKYEELDLIKKESGKIFTDKTLDNFFFLGIIKNIFPHAKIINCQRNSLSSIISILKNNLGDVSWAHNLENIFSYFDLYYKKINTFKNNFPNFIYNLNFENFQNNPEIESKKLMEFCDLPWDKECLEFYKRKDVISYTASHRQIRNPIYKVSSKKNEPYKNFLYKYGKKYEWFK
tara:strand:- start:1266 stop:2921 length:1656 start_codon:yes stop_codon:yes gene_type:complete